MENKKTILIVEDDLALRSALRDKLVDSGLGVIEAKDGEEGLKIALAEHPDLMLIDIVMPKMGGLAMLGQIRKDDWGKDVKCIILTNVDDIGEIDRAMKLVDIEGYGSFEYFVKTDVKIEEVVEKVKQKLGV